MAADRVLDRLAAEEACLGAVFLTYGFDPAFFEEHIVRAIHRLTSDPVEHAERYYDEAIGALQLAPTVVIADASQRRPGRRLPYELLEVSSRVFHPKVVLLLYEDFARLQVGSGNISRGGYGGNTELFLAMDLAYSDTESRPLLLEHMSYLHRIGQMARQTPRELVRVLDELGRRLEPTPSLAAPKRAAFRVLDSTTAPILGQALSLLPAGARVDRVGFLAPFFEQDDADALADSSSIFAAIRESCGTNITLDIGVLWNNPPLRNLSAQVFELEAHADQLWAWDAQYNDGSSLLEYITPRKLTASLLKYTDAHGESRTFDRETVALALAEARLWPVPAPIAFAPSDALDAAAAAFRQVHLWLHPSSQLVDHRPLYRPLHAKLLLFTYEYRGKLWTLVVVGSANASRAALTLSTETSGNVELCVAFCLAGRQSLKTLVPDLVWTPRTALELQERSFPVLPPNIALAIDEAVYYAATGNLHVVWSKQQSLAPWVLEYVGKTIAQGDQPAASTTVIDDFRLERSTSELVLRSEASEASVPILVDDLVALPAGEAHQFGLQELLLLIGKRLGLERLKRLRTRNTNPGEASPLEELFGVGVDPTQVFRAWWVVAADLADPHATLQSMRLRLDGSLGVRVVWQKLKEASADGSLAADATWFFGAELLRTLRDVEYDATATGIAKLVLLDEFRSDLEADLRRHSPAKTACPWADRVRAFYKV